MPVRRLITMVGVAIVCTASVLAQQAMTESEYEAAMKEINFIVGDAELHIDARYWPEVLDDLGKLRSQFERVEGFWVARGTDEAATLARRIIEGTSPIASAADERDRQAAMVALRELRTICQSCHESFRQQANGGYRIKP